MHIDLFSDFFAVQSCNCRQEVQSSVADPVGFSVAHEERLEIELGMFVDVLDRIEVVSRCAGNLHDREIVCFGDEDLELSQAFDALHCDALLELSRRRCNRHSLNRDRLWKPLRGFPNGLAERSPWIAPEVDVGREVCSFEPQADYRTADENDLRRLLEFGVDCAQERFDFVFIELTHRWLV